ncbi:MAG: hypothetical protein KatS3mg111_2853 [Pirellulaceae bacterium]|nr:MAG: hypothetical protein KatS3mg111_2853 [Pirellulaceae bacterium]
MRQSLGCWAFPGRAWERDDIQNGEQTPFGPVFSKANRNNNSSLEYFAASYGTGRGAYQSLASALTGASASLSGDGDSQGFAVLLIDQTSDYAGSERQQAGFNDVWEGSSTSNSSLHLTLVDHWDSTGSLSASLAADGTSTWNGSASSSATSSVDYQQHYDSVDQAIMLLGEMGWDYQSLRDASFQRSANWNALFDPSTGQFDESFTVSGDDEVLLSGYEYHPTNTNLWKTPLEEALEELFPLDYLDTTGDPPSSTDPSASDQSGDSSDGGDLDGYAGDYQGDLFGEEQGGSSGGVYYTAYSGSGQSETYSSSSPSRSGWGGFWDKVQLGLDVVGCIPVIGEAADGVNGVISLARGDHVGAGLSFASMIPVYGDIVGKGGKVARYAAKYGDEAAEAGKRLVDSQVSRFNTRYGTYARRIDEYKHALDIDHVRAAAREKAGEIVATKKSGVPFDHLNETREAMHGVHERIPLLKKYLSDPNLTPEQRAAIEAELSEASKLLDRAERILGESAPRR